MWEDHVVECLCRTETPRVSTHDDGNLFGGNKSRRKESRFSNIRLPMPHEVYNETRKVVSCE